MKKLLMILAVSSASFIYSFDCFMCCFCCKKKEPAKQTRIEWVDTNFAQDLQDLGIACKAKDLSKLTPQQRFYLQGLKDSYLAHKRFDFYVQSSAHCAKNYPEPFKSGLKKLNKNFVQLKQELALLQTLSAKQTLSPIVP